MVSLLLFGMWSEMVRTFIKGRPVMRWWKIWLWFLVLMIVGLLNWAIYLAIVITFFPAATSTAAKADCVTCEKEGYQPCTARPGGCKVAVCPSVCCGDSRDQCCCLHADHCTCTWPPSYTAEQIETAIRLTIAAESFERTTARLVSATSGRR